MHLERCVKFKRDIVYNIIIKTEFIFKKKLNFFLFFNQSLTHTYIYTYTYIYIPGIWTIKFLKRN